MTSLSDLIRRSFVVAVAAGTTLLAPTVALAAPKGLFEGNYSSTSNTISEFTIGTGGLLTPFSSVAAGGESWLLAATPNGKYLYSTSFNGASVSEYSIHGASLTPLSPATVPTQSGPTQLAVSPDGKNVYVAGSEIAGGLSIYTVGSGGVLALLATVTTDLSEPSGVAVSPNGSSVYVAGYGGAITEFNRAGDGNVTPKTAFSIPTGLSQDINLTMTPNGRYLYASGNNSTLIDEFSVGSGGELAALSPATAVEGKENYLLEVSPNGRNLYAASCTAGAVYQYTIATNGELAPLSPAAATTAGACPYDEWMSAKGSALYAPDSNSPTGDVSQFSVSSSGVLTAMSPGSVPAGFEADDVMIAPDQGPIARFSVKAGKAGTVTKLNASKSRAPDGKVVKYIWKIGHKTKTTHSAKLSVKFKRAGHYKVTLTVVDDSGCSTSEITTGQVAYCNGSKAARTSHKVRIKKA